ncbi:putative tricarboxylic transport membrane protein [Brachybacterium sp. AG952]|uniref:Bug family tripartite tricarboxylate transporter substrate binding protein n=1 Tax=Brachybacterium sp. AG952 TaxID=2183989 RepID=UPI0010621665|nr:tripartite tricarboxylate transporter substrate binding protein [Brachybacterium sp. AG952]TDP78114.1 putative tricarboxylic transport membrane protein [Brachybacterium sp. AG952]HIY23928.1 tripartite tricarboxylate transporter substrate binding protein [Candidatus Brachybacterium merdigallinarum]
MKRRSVLTAGAIGTVGLALSACSGGSGGGSSADGEFDPGNRVTMIVPFSAGGGSDIAGRAIAAGLEEATGATITVENRVGGSGAVGYSGLVNAEGDGTMLLASETALITLPIVQDVDFTYESFTPIMKAGEDYNLVVVASDSPFQSITDVIEAAKTEQLNAAVSGATGPDHIAWSLIEQEQGITLERVTFESSSEVLAALMGGHVQVAASSPGELTGQLESGDIRALCALAPERYEYDLLADIPTGSEEGVEVTFAQWRGFIAPGGIDDAAKEYWIAKAKEYEQSDAYKEFIESNMLQPVTAYGDDFVEYLHQYAADVESVLGN